MKIVDADSEVSSSELSPNESARFREWFDEFDAKAWDEQFERYVGVANSMG